MDRRTIKLTYQIKDFIKSNHQLVSLVKPSIGEVINYITARQPRPIDLITLIESGTDRNKRTSRASSLEPTLYFPIDWSIDKPEFKKSLITFIKDI